MNIDELERQLLVSNEVFFRRWVIDQLIEIRLIIADGAAVQKQIDDLTAEILKNRDRMIVAQKP